METNPSRKNRKQYWKRKKNYTRARILTRSISGSEYNFLSFTNKLYYS